MRTHEYQNACRAVAAAFAHIAASLFSYIRQCPILTLAPGKEYSKFRSTIRIGKERAVRLRGRKLFICKKDHAPPTSSHSSESVFEQFIHGNFEASVFETERFPRRRYLNQARIRNLELLSCNPPRLNISTESNILRR